MNLGPYFFRAYQKLTVGLWITAGLLLGLAGCAAAPGGVSVVPVLRVAQEDGAHGPAALDRAVADFIGPSSGAGTAAAVSGRGGSSSRFLNIGPDTVFADAGTIRYEVRSAREVAAGLHLERPLGAGRALEGQLLAGRGSARYLLPEGAAAFKSPITMRAGTRFAEARGGVSQALPMGPIPGRASLSGGAGLRLTESRLHVTSDLLDVRSRSGQSSPFADLRLEYRPDALPARGFAEARLHGRHQMLVLRLGLDMTLP